jgi:archaellum biogenesis ATPase FlaH
LLVMSEHIVRGIDLSVEGKIGCPRCTRNGNDNSQDNLMVYGLDRDQEHKGAFCWACDYTIPSQKWLQENGQVIEEEIEYVGSLFNEEIHNRLKDNTTVDPKGFRGLRKDTTQFFGVRHELNAETGEVLRQYYPCTEGDDSDKAFDLSGYKNRIVPKDFSKPVGETGKECHLFGQFRFLQERGRDVLIVGGELDQLSAYQMLKDATDKKNSRNGTEYTSAPVVSPTIGESGAYKQILAQYDWLNRFERILVCMDNDAAGREAAEKICKVLPKGKAFIVELGLKDPNSYVWDKDKGVAVHREAEFIQAFYRPQPYTPSGIVGSGTLMGLIKAAAVVPKIPLPPFMHKVQKMMAGGIPLKTITNLGSASGTGKSTIADECVYYWVFNSPHKIGVVSLETDCAQYGTKILSRHLGTKLDLIEDDQFKVELLNTAEVEQKAKELFYNPDGTHRWHLIEERDGSLGNLKELITTLIISCECKVVILDPLQDILDGLNVEEQAVFMKWMKGMIKSHDVAFILINHVRKSGNSGKANSTGADLHEEDFQGSSSIFKSAACNLLFTRNKEAESELERNTTTMKMTKCRWTGQTAPVAGKFYYNNKEHRLYDLDDFLSAHPEMYCEMS